MPGCIFFLRALKHGNFTFCDGPPLHALSLLDKIVIPFSLFSLTIPSPLSSKIVHLCFYIPTNTRSIILCIYSSGAKNSRKLPHDLVQFFCFVCLFFGCLFLLSPLIPGSTRIIVLLTLQD